VKIGYKDLISLDLELARKIGEKIEKLVEKFVED